MKISSIFEVFSRRKTDSGQFTYNVPESFRNKVIMYCTEVFSNKHGDFGGENYLHQFWSEIHQMLLYRHGVLQLGSHPTRSSMEDTVNFLLACNSEEFLDFIEYIFRVECLFHLREDENTLVDAINTFFVSENIGFELTRKITETVNEPINAYPFHGRMGTAKKTIAEPQIIRKDNTVIHASVTEPVLTLLANPQFKSANQEYLEALEDYKQGDYGDCLTKCCSSFESTMKIICNMNGWPFKQTDTAGVLIDTILKNTALDTFFSQPLLIIGTLRNRLSKSHGAGTQPKNVSQNLALYALNATASAIILLVNETT